MIWAALSFGLVTSFHCIGMCGPIALSLPQRQGPWASRIIAVLLYNLGRASTYTLLGAVFGTFGMGLKMISFHFQQWFSIAFGIAMILSVLFPTIFRRAGSPALLRRFMERLKAALAKRFGDPGYTSLFSIGVLNGFLPCGPVYMAIGLALASSSVTDGALYMFMFGIGTMPTMLALSLAGNLVTIRFRNIIRKVIPFIIVAIGILFILRGMNLGIHGVSPRIERQADKVVLECCKDGTQAPSDSL